MTLNSEIDEINSKMGKNDPKRKGWFEE